MVYPICIHCGKRYFNQKFLYAHYRKYHAVFYGTFIQTRVKYLVHTKKNRAMNVLKTWIIRRRFIKLKYHTNRIKHIYLEHTYAPHKKGFQRAQKTFKIASQFKDSV